MFWDREMLENTKIYPQVNSDFSWNSTFQTKFSKQTVWNEKIRSSSSSLIQFLLCTFFLDNSQLVFREIDISINKSNWLRKGIGQKPCLNLGNSGRTLPVYDCARGYSATISRVQYTRINSHGKLFINWLPLWSTQYSSQFSCVVRVR